MTVEYEPLARSTWQLIEQAESREAALAQVNDIMARATGTAHDVSRTVEVTVDARGKLLNLVLAPHAEQLGERLGQHIVDVARVAQQVATQASYNKVALLLGDELTYVIEQISGLRAPARAEQDDGVHITPEEFMRRRAERLGEAGSPAAPPPHDSADEDWESFDPASLRSNR